MQCSKEAALHLQNAIKVELEVIPWVRIGYHIPACRIGTIGLECLKGIDSVTQTLRHLVTILVQHQTIGDDIFKRHASEDHYGKRVKGKEPSSGLINTFRDKIGREAFVKDILVLERIMPLRIGHGARIEPNVDKVRFTVHRLAIIAYKHHLINIGPVKIEILRQAFLHETRRNCLLHLPTQFWKGTDTLLFRTVFRDPDGQRGAPETGSGKVPVNQVLKPVAKAPCSR